MDQNESVEGGADGLLRIARAFQSRGVAVSGVYLIKLTSDDSFGEWIVRLVSDRKSPELARKMIWELVKLRRESLLPKVDTGVRFDIVSSDDIEASRVIEYARRLGGPPIVIRDTMWRGLFIEYALVAMVPQSDLAIA